MAYFLTSTQEKPTPMMLRKPTRLAVLLILAVGCKTHRTPQPTPLLNIDTVIAQADTLTMRYRFTSHLQSLTRAIIQPRVSGFLLQKSYRAGEMVHRGQRLFTIDASLLRTTLRSAEADLSAAMAELTTARNDYERALPLARLNAISASQLDAYRASFASAEGAVKAAQEAVENARLQVGYATIYAPIDGIVANSDANVGDYVGPDTKYSTLTTIDATDTLTIDVAIPTSLYMQYSDPTRPSSDNSTLLSDIRLRLSDGQEYPHKGRYDYTRQSVSPTAGTITIVVAFPNPEHRLKAGEYGEVECGIGPAQRVITLPVNAVTTLQDKHIVWVIGKDSTAQWREVTLGVDVGGRWIIRQGITEGEQVAIEGSQKLHQGVKVIPQPKK